MINSQYDNYKHWSDKGSVYLISDPHFNDPNSFAINPNWLSADVYVNILNKMIHKNDTLICLGDCGDINYFKQLKAGYKILIKGNHDDKGNAFYQRKEEVLQFNKFDFNQKELREHLKQEYPNHKITITDGQHFDWQYNGDWIAFIDNMLFDEVYDGPIFISDQILLSHEPINGLQFCCNIHGHCHNYHYDYTDNLGGRHLNIAADVIQWQPLDLNRLIKAGITSKLPTIHRLVIDRASENPIHKN